MDFNTANGNLQVDHTPNSFHRADWESQWTAYLDDRTYRQMLSLADELLRRERNDFSYQGRDLLHDAFIRLLNAEKAIKCLNEGHLTRLLRLTMRRMLIDLVRAANGKKRGGGSQHLPIDETRIEGDCGLAKQLAVQQVTDRLAQVNLRQARVVELRISSASLIEIAAELSISVRTVKRDLAATRKWLSEKRKETEDHLPIVCRKRSEAKPFLA